MKSPIALVSIVAASLACSLQAHAVISESQAFQAVRDFIGNQNAVVTYADSEKGPKVYEPMNSFLDFWSNRATAYRLASGAYEYRVNADNGAIESIMVTSDLDVYPGDALNAETIWSKFPQLPRAQMQQKLNNPDAESWYLRYADGTWCHPVKITFWKNEQGLIDMVTTKYQPLSLPLPTPSMTSQQAQNIAQTIAGSYAYIDIYGNLNTKPYYDVADISGIIWRLNAQGNPEAVYELDYIISADPAVNASWLDENSTHGAIDFGIYHVFVNAMTGAIIYSDVSVFYSASETKSHSSSKAGKTKAAGIKTITRVVPLPCLQALAKGHKLSAMAGEKAFTLDGKRVALPSKITAKAGTLYLPWQSLKSLPDVKCSYDAKLNRLDITTAKAINKI